jgi:hypothetical protein
MPARQGICTDSIVQVCFQGLTGFILFMSIHRQGHPALRTFSVKIAGGICMQALTFGAKIGGLPSLTYQRQTTVGFNASIVV